MPVDNERLEREAKAKRLVEARKAAGFAGPKAVSDALNLNINTYKAHEVGRNGFGQADAKTYAEAFGVRLEWLYFGEGEMTVDAGAELRPARAPTQAVVVAGKVAAGVFREVDDLDQSDPPRFLEPADERFPHARRMGFDVDGDSMDNLRPRPIMPGDRLVCVSFEDIAAEIKVRDGLVVVVERTRDGGHTREWSVKQIELYEDRIEFHPRSTNPRHKPIVVRRDAQADEGVQVEIIALVRSVRNDMPF